MCACSLFVSYCLMHQDMYGILCNKKTFLTGTGTINIHRRIEGSSALNSHAADKTVVDCARIPSHFTFYILVRLRTP